MAEPLKKDDYVLCEECRGGKGQLHHIDTLKPAAAFWADEQEGTVCPAGHRLPEKAK